MPSPIRAAAVLPVLALLVLVAGCARARMPVPSDLAAVEPMPVEGRGGWRGSQRAVFGPYQATDVERSWTRGGGWRVGIGGIGGGSNRAAQEYSFRFRADGAELGTVRCHASGARGTVGAVIDVDLSARESLECSQAGATPDAEPVWDLSLQASRDRHLEGSLRIGEARYTVVSTGRGGRFSPAEAYGFEFRDGDRTVAAVEIVNDGAVWLAPEVSDARRTAIAAAAAALLLYDRLETD